MKKYSITLGIAVAYISIFPVRADSQVCTQQEAFSAEEESDRFTNWSALYRSYKRYKHCDDGAISEGYSYSVNVLLTKYWDRADVLVALAKRAPEFEDFVMSHVNETMSVSEADAILRNVTNSCPKSGAKICMRLKSAAELVKSRL